MVLVVHVPIFIDPYYSCMNMLTPFVMLNRGTAYGNRHQLQDLRERDVRGR
jgi:hypothetical protein